MEPTDRELARAQWAAQVVVIRRNQRRLAKTLTRAYMAGFALWQSNALFDIPQAEQIAVASALRVMWMEAGQVGGRIPVSQEKAAFPGLELKSGEITLFEQIMLAFIDRFGAAQVARVLDTTRAQLRVLINGGITEGLGQEAIAARITERVPTIAKARARVIARTETHNAAMYASDQVAKTAQFPLQERWMSVYDHRTRDFGEGDGKADQANHRIMNEVTIQPGENFAVPNAAGGVDIMSGPGDLTAPAYQTINCRCALVYRRVGRPWPKAGEV